MANATRATQFRQKLDKVLNSLAQQAQRQVVASLPPSMGDLRRRHAHMLNLVSGGLDEDQQELVLQMLNTDWRETLEPGDRLHHVCEPGCCSSESSFHLRMKQVLQLLFSHLFSAPLLYRWKGFDEACAYVARGMVIRKLLRTIWTLSCKADRAGHSDAFAEQAQAQQLDEDHADACPSIKQQIRVSKVMQLLAEDDATDPCPKKRFVRRVLPTTWASPYHSEGTPCTGERWCV